jgi:hypothetical protein
MAIDSENRFAFDLRRTLLLSRYIGNWGQPDKRRVAEKGDERIEVYCFPGAGTRVTRFATVGLSAPEGPDAELLLTVPADHAGASLDEVFSFVLDVAVYCRRPGIHLEPGSLVPESPLVPKAWRARALLFDEPRGEKEELEQTHVGQQAVRLIWAVPIHGDEYNLIERDGIEAFDRRIEEAGMSLAEPDRRSVA